MLKNKKLEYCSDYVFQELKKSINNLTEELRKVFLEEFRPIANFFFKFIWLYWIMVAVMTFVILVDIYITFLIL